MIIVLSVVMGRLWRHWGTNINSKSELSANIKRRGTTIHFAKAINERSISEHQAQRKSDSLHKCEPEPHRSHV
eukprot:10141356-Heterocapsa_arctica.AAC.1